MDSRDVRKLRMEFGVSPPMSADEASRLAIQSAASIGGVHPLAAADIGDGGPDPKTPRITAGAARDDANGVFAAGARRIRASVRGTMIGVLGHFDGPVSEEITIEKERVRGEIDGLKTTIVPARIEAAEAERDLADTEAEVLATGTDPHPWLRRLPTWVYVPVLLLAATFAAYLNATALRVFREGELYTVLGAMAYALAFMGGTHQIGLGLSDESRRSRLRFWGAVVLLVTLSFGAWAIAQVRGDYLEVVGENVADWKFLALQLVIDAVATVAAVMHANLHADALWTRRRRRDRKWQVLEALLGKLAEREHRLVELDQELFSEGEAHAQTLRRLGEYQLELIDVYQRTLEHRRGPLPKGTIKAGDLAPSFPERLMQLEAWLDQHARRLDRPRRLPPPPAPRALGAGNGSGRGGNRPPTTRRGGPDDEER